MTKNNETKYHIHKEIIATAKWGTLSGKLNTSSVCSQNKHLIIFFLAVALKKHMLGRWRIVFLIVLFCDFCTVLICQLMCVWTMKRCNNRKLWMSSWENIWSKPRILGHPCLPPCFLRGRHHSCLTITISVFCISISWLPVMWGPWGQLWSGFWYLGSERVKPLTANTTKNERS